MFEDIDTEQAKLYRKNMQKFANHKNDVDLECDDESIFLYTKHIELQPVEAPETYIDNNGNFITDKLKNFSGPSLLYLMLWKCLKENREDWQWIENQYWYEYEQDMRKHILDIIDSGVEYVFPEYCYFCKYDYFDSNEGGECVACGICKKECIEDMKEWVCGELYPGSIEDETYRWH